MPIALATTNKFLNCREWRSFLKAAELPSPYPSVAAAMRAGRDWLTGGATTSYSWLMVNGNPASGSSETLGA
jgi:hypothetical protein